MFLNASEILEIPEDPHASSRLLRLPMPSRGCLGIPTPPWGSRWCLMPLLIHECLWRLLNALGSVSAVYYCVCLCFAMFINVFECFQMYVNLSCLLWDILDGYKILNISCDYHCLARMNSLADITWMHFDNFVGPFSLFRMFNCSVILYVTRRCCISIKHVLAVLTFLMIIHD